MGESVIDNKEWRDALSKYVSDEKYVYKLCYNFTGSNCKREWLVVLEKLYYTRTNEKRSNVVDASCAKFRADVLQVVEIINVNDPKITTNKILNTYDYVIVKYEVGESVVANKYDDDVDNICSGGIHYFKSFLPAYYFRDVPEKYIGDWIFYFDSGQKYMTCKYKNGTISMACDAWYENGKKYIEIKVLDSTDPHFKSTYMEWYDNGKNKMQGEFFDEMKSGHWISWHDNGNKFSEGDYVEGKKTGHWVVWSLNGEILADGDFVNGKERGAWEYLREGKKIRKNYDD